MTPGLWLVNLVAIDLQLQVTCIINHNTNIHWSETMLLPFFFYFACSDVKDGHDHDHDHEVMTTVVLNFTDESGETSEYQFIDLQDGNDPTIDEITLSAGTHTLAVSFLNELETPSHDVTQEISDEEDEHQIFFSGDVENCSSGTALVQHAYTDTDSEGHPIGLSNTITPIAEGTGELIVSLRHLAMEDGQLVKTGSLYEDFCNGDDIPGDWDVQVTFPLSSHTH